MVFPEGPFFNIRLLDEFPWWKKILWKIAGVKKVETHEGYRVTAYYYKNITFVSKFEEV